MIAMAAGAGLAALSYVVMTQVPPDSVARYFVENAYTQGGGTNVVNVILVDFRGFDTFGEITVLAAVALTVYALLRRFRPARRKSRRSRAAAPRKEARRLAIAASKTSLPFRRSSWRSFFR